MGSDYQHELFVSAGEWKIWSGDTCIHTHTHTPLYIYVTVSQEKGWRRTMTKGTAGRKSVKRKVE